MAKYLLFILFILVGCHGRTRYLAIDDGMVMDKKSGDVFEVKPDQKPPFKYVGNLNEFRGLNKKGCKER